MYHQFILPLYKTVHVVDVIYETVHQYRQTIGYRHMALDTAPIKKYNS